MEFTKSEIYLLHDLVFKLDKYAHTVLEKKLNLTYNHFLMLVAISLEHINNQQDIVAHMNLSKTSVSLRIKELVDENLVLQKIDPEHRRQKIISLTKKGDSLRKRAENIILNEAEQLMVKSRIDRVMMKKSLESMLENI